MCMEELTRFQTPFPLSCGAVQSISGSASAPLDARVWDLVARIPHSAWYVQREGRNFAVL